MYADAFSFLEIFKSIVDFCPKARIIVQSILKWSSFEDDVKKDNKDLYEKVEKYLDPTIAGSEAKTN